MINLFEEFPYRQNRPVIQLGDTLTYLSTMEVMMALEKKDLRVIRTVHLLKESLHSQLEQASLEEISVLDICSDAMVHRATFYKHFQDKYHLFQEVLEDIGRQVVELPETFGPEQGLELYMKTADRALEYIDSNRESLQKILRANKDSMAYFMIFNAIQQAITELLNRTQWKRTPALPLDVISRFMTSGLSGVVFYWLESASPISKKEMFESIHAIIGHNLYWD